MKILLTGSSGFIGCHVIKQIKKNNYKLIISSRNLSKKNNRGIIWKSYDLFKKRENLYNYFDYPDTLIHLAWNNLPNYTSSTHPDQVKYHYVFLKSMIMDGYGMIVE